MPRNVRRTAREGCYVDAKGRVSDEAFHAEILGDDRRRIDPLSYANHRRLALAAGWSEADVVRLWGPPPDAL